MSTEMAASQPGHFGSRGKLSKSEQTHLARRYTKDISANMIRTAVTAEWDHPQIGSWGNSPLASRGAKTLIKRPKRVGYTTLKV